MAMILFTHPGACSRVTMTALEEAGADYEARWIDLAASAQHDDDYLAFNRKGKVPALIVDGVTLTENPAILHYLHSAYPAAGLLPAGKGPFDRAQSLSDLVWCGSMLHPIVRQIRAPQRFTKGETSGIVADGREKLSKECKYIDSRLSNADWWYGANWSIVDVYLFWIVSNAARSGFHLDSYPAIVAHIQRVRSRPSFKRMHAKENAAIEAHNIGVDQAGL